MYKKIFSLENMLLLILMLVAMAVGIWGNYRQLWLESNGFTVQSISKLVSVGMICSSIIALLITFLSTKVRIKETITIALSSNAISLLGLICLNTSNKIFLIKILTLITIITENIFWIGIYPLFTSIKKDKKIYSKKTIIQNTSKDIGILITGLMLGKVIYNKVINYNFIIYLSVMLITVAVILLGSINYEEQKDNNIKCKSFISSLKYIFKSKINILFLIYVLLSNASYDVLIGLQMLIYINMFKFTNSFASIFILVSGIISSLIAILVVKYVKIKSNFNANLLKYIPRLTLYILAFITNKIEIAISAIFITLITSRMVSEYTDGIYINLIDNNIQFMYSNIRYFIIALGESLGYFIAGITYNIGLKYIFLATIIILIPQLFISLIISNMYKKIK